MEECQQEMPEVYKLDMVATDAAPGVNCPSNCTSRVFATTLAHNPNCATGLKRTPMFGVFGEPLTGVSVKAAEKVLTEEAKHCNPVLPVERRFLEYGAVVAKKAFGVETGTPRRVLTVDEAINGFNGSPGLDMTKSPGYPYVSLNKTRLDLFQQGANGLWKMKDEFASGFGKYHACYRAGRIPVNFAAPDLKDERLKLTKIADGKIRTFEKMMMEYLLMVRMYYGAFNDHLTRSVGRTPSAIGINRLSHQWHELWTKFVNFVEGDLSTPCAFDADFKAFEATLTKLACEYVVDVINTWARSRRKTLSGEEVS